MGIIRKLFNADYSVKIYIIGGLRITGTDEENITPLRQNPGVLRRIFHRESQDLFTVDRNKACLRKGKLTDFQ